MIARWHCLSCHVTLFSSVLCNDGLSEPFVKECNADGRKKSDIAPKSVERMNEWRVSQFCTVRLHRGGDNMGITRFQKAQISFFQNRIIDSIWYWFVTLNTSVLSWEIHIEKILNLGNMVHKFKRLLLTLKLLGASVVQWQHAGLLANRSSNWSCARGMIHNKIYLICPACPRPNIALQCRIMI